jgi:hypothetical protein
MANKIVHEVFPLPNGVTIVTETNPTGNYEILQAGILCFPFIIQTGQQVYVTASQNAFFNSQQSVLSGWASVTPYGESISYAPNYSNNTVNLTSDHGNTFCYYDVNLPMANVQAAAVQQWINVGQQYYFNVQNRENRNNGVYVDLVYS